MSWVPIIAVGDGEGSGVARGRGRWSLV